MTDMDDSVESSRMAKKKADDVQGEVDEILENLPKHANRLRQLRVTVSDLNSGVGISDDECKS